jgi:hypothetical protein
MFNLSTAPTKNPNLETLRVLMPLMIVVIILVVANKLLGKAGDVLSAPLEALGIADTKEEKRAKSALSDNLKGLREMGARSPFSPLYYKALEKRAGKNQAVKLITQATREKWTKQIRDGIGAMYDSPAQIEGVFQNLSYKSQVSFLTERFNQRYQTDLLSWLTEKLDTTAQKEALLRITQYVNGLPSGLVAKGK